MPSAVPDLLSPAIPISLTGTKILGIPIGSHDFILNVCIDVANSCNVFCQQLPDLNEPQGATLLLRHCHATRLNHLARGVCQDSLQPAATIHDRLTKKCFTTLIGTRDLTTSQWEQATLPIRLGGFGMTLHAANGLPFCLFIQLGHSLQELPNRFTSLADHVRTVLSNCKDKGSIGYQLDQLLDDDRDLSEVVSNTKKLQHRLTDANNQITVNALIDSSSQKDAARLLSLQGKGAGAWLSAVPSSKKFALSPNSFILAASVRLGIPVSFPEWVNNCDCGRTLDIKGSDADGFHFITCTNDGGPVWTHDSMMSVWSECLSSVHVPHKCEPRDCYTHSNNRPEILVYDSETGSNVELDVALAHPWASDILPRAVTTGGRAAMRREQSRKTSTPRDDYPVDILQQSCLLYSNISAVGGGGGENAFEYLKVLSALWGMTMDDLKLLSSKHTGDDDF